MSAQWKPLRLDELGFVGRGRSRHRPRNDARLYGGSYPFIQTADIMAADPYITSYSQTYSEFGLQQSKLWPPKTLCMTIAGANTAETAILKFEACFPDSIVGFIPYKTKADLHFVKYSLDLMKGKFRAVTRGATQDNLSLDKLLSFPIQTPPILIQRWIAGILSAYDDLIENNLRRIKVLEEMARLLYREWFVHFRFPGHEKVSFVDSPLGNIPEGWEVKYLPECIDINPRIGVPRDGKKPFVPMGCLSNDLMLISNIESRDGNSGAKFQNGDTLFARITPCLENGKTGFVQFLPNAEAVACGSTEFIVLRSRTLSPEFVYCLARSDEFRGNAIKSMSGATGRQRVQEHCFDGFQIARPPDALLGRFSAIVTPSFHLIHTLHLQIQNLRETRDMLLPRLLAGETELRNVNTESVEVEANDRVEIENSADESKSELAPKDQNRLGSPRLEIVSPIDQTDRAEVLAVIRHIFSDGFSGGRENAIRAIARELGYHRTGHRIQQILDDDLRAAVRRGILDSSNGELRLLARSIIDYDRDFLKKQFLAAIERGWIRRDEAIQTFARWLGFRRTGPVIDETARSLINGLIREGRLEAEGPELIRRVS
jgi:type I restriction enzyme S subunit